MIIEYTRDQIIEPLKQYFTRLGFKCESYFEGLGEVRLPLYCFKKQEDEIQEVCIDIITERTISNETYFPKIRSQKVTIENACSIKFFQYYLPRAKIYWAHGHYVSKDRDYDKFKTTCQKNGIGILEVSDQDVQVLQEAVSLHEILGSQLEEEIDGAAKECRITEEVTQSLLSLVGRLEDEYLHYLVYYADPQFRRRAIRGRHDTPDLSLILMNKLQEIKHLQYHEVLVQLAMNYRNENRDDPEIALQTIQGLWKSQLQIDYPDIHKESELVLLLNPNYRDHFLHQFQVFLLGTLIVDKLYNTTPIQTFEQSCGSKFEDAWLAASTYHDFNYSIEKYEEWMTSFLERTLHVSDPQKDLPFTLDLEKIVIRDEFLSKMKGLCASINYNLDDCFLKFILGRVAWDKNHAVLGALTFLNKCQNKSRLTESAANHAAMSILLHDDKNWQYFCGKGKITNKRPWEQQFCKLKLIPQLTFDSLPLEFLLTFCDAVQEWGRVGRDYEVTKPALENVEVDEQRILIHISVEDDSSCDKKQKEVQNLKQYLKDDRFGIEIQSRRGTMSTTIWMGGA